MSLLEADIRRDANPTPTRFLLECGAFTPGFGLNTDSFNPFDASYKFLNTGTPKAELNPFDTSFRTPSAAISVVTTSQPSQPNSVPEEIPSLPVLDHHPWADIVFNGSPAASSASSASPSPPLASPPATTAPYYSFHPLPTTMDPKASQQPTYEHASFFESAPVPKMPKVSNDMVLDLPPAKSPRDTPYYETSKAQPYDAVDDQQHQQDQDDDGMDVDSDHSGEAESEGASQSRRHSSDSIEMSRGESSSNAIQAGSFKPKASAKSKKNPKPTTTKTSSRKAKASVQVPLSRKHSAAPEEVSPEAKRQKFLERNRMAASKCREKKRLQTLKTISDADEITARNQALHQSLEELQEEVRHLKDQILAHRDCGCDVVQKFVQSSFDFSGRPTVPMVYPDHAAQKQYAYSQQMF